MYEVYDKVIAIAALARNCAVQLPGNIERIEKLRNFFSRSYVIIVENDSTDGTKEKDINLAVTLRLKAMLESAGFQVKMTRETDIAVNDPNLDTVKQRKVSDIKNRLKLIQNTPNCIFISIHQNHFSESKYNGTQVFYSKNHEDSKAIAEDIQNQVVTFIQPENKREIKPATESIYLLWNTNVPAVLVECGFLSNPSEAQLLKDVSYQDKMAFSIFCGILKYMSQ